MSEYGQAPLHGKAERHNEDKPREWASERANGEEAGRGVLKAGLVQDAVAI
jgi:hypothetical protein